MNNMKHAVRPNLLRDTRGATGSSYVMTILLVAVVGIGGMQSLGGAMGKSIANDESGQGMAVSAQAGEGDPLVVSNQPGEGGPPPGTTTTTTLPSAQPGTETNASGNGNAGNNGKSSNGGDAGNSGDADEGDDGCGMNPFCYIGEAAEWVGDLPVLGQAVRFTGGLVDGIWDGVFEIGRGIKELVESVGWDFLVEDVLAGTVKGLAGVGCKLISFGQACHESSWNPIKSATNSIGNFFTKLPEVRHVIGNALHQASLCTNPWNGQSSEDRGHACGETVVAVVDIVIATKGITKLAKIAKEAYLARKAARAAEAAKAAEAAEAAKAAEESAGNSGKTTPDEGKGPGGPKKPTVPELEAVEPKLPKFKLDDQGRPWKSVDRDNALEHDANAALEAETGNRVLAAGDDAVRDLLDLGKKDKAVDFVAKSDKGYIVADAKAGNIGTHGVDQIQKIAQKLVDDGHVTDPSQLDLRIVQQEGAAPRTVVPNGDLAPELRAPNVADNVLVEAATDGVPTAPVTVEVTINGTKHQIQVTVDRIDSVASDYVPTKR
jgi:Flp pilus assembly pilin Flp